MEYFAAEDGAGAKLIGTTLVVVSGVKLTSFLPSQLRTASSCLNGKVLSLAINACSSIDQVLQISTKMVLCTYLFPAVVLMLVMSCSSVIVLCILLLEEACFC
jgi:hypothetical protein